MTIDTTPLNHAEEYKALCVDAASRVKEVSFDDVWHRFKAGETFHLIDVREADEFSEGHIDGAVHLSKGWIEAKIHTLVNDPSEDIVLYCGSGKRSLLAADNLQKMGYSNVKSMSGGIKGWVNAQHPLA
ncbi:MAG: sulfurtransferase [Micavibrio sp.]|nr:sulfurtransferase [Micavibrio sp.]